MLLSDLVSDGLLQKMLSFSKRERLVSEAMLLEQLSNLKDVMLIL